MEISNPAKVYFPDEGITKGEVVEYYSSVAEAMVPHLDGRPLTLQRFPDGIGKSGFMQKNASKHFPDTIKTVEIPKEDGTTNYPLCDTADDLVYLANQGTITFHIWTARMPNLDQPDRLVLDLDPAEGAEAPRSAALTAKTVMEEVGLAPGLMTTGSKGYHLVALIEPESSYEEVGAAARWLAGVVARRSPEETTTEFLKKERKGRVFVDWLRNRTAQSVVAPWSVRPKARAPVAMPIGWEELDDTDPTRWTIADAPERISVDPWPSPPSLDTLTVRTVAEEANVDLDEEFDRFGRKRT